MPRNSRVWSRGDRHVVSPRPEMLEPRRLLSGSTLAVQAPGAAQKEQVSVEVASTYVSQSATSMNVTLTRSMGVKGVPIDSQLILKVDVVALAPAVKRGGKPQESQEIAPQEGAVVFQPGQMTATVAVPIEPQTALPPLVPLQITVSPQSHPRNQAVATVDLAQSEQAVPPSITGASLVKSGSVARGIEITFSEPMSAASVENIHNYVVKSVPLDQVTLSSLASLSVLQPEAVTAPSPVSVPLKSARYDAATNSVLLVPKSPLKVAKSFIVRSPATLGTRHAGPRAAAPLTDANGNVLNPLNSPAGSFTITINPKSS